MSSPSITKKENNLEVICCYAPNSKEEEQWRLKRFFELLLEADLRRFEELRKEKYRFSYKLMG